MNASSQAGAFRNVRPVLGRDFAEVMRTLWPEPVAAEIIDHFRRTLATGEPYCSPRFTSPRQDIGIVESYEWELHRILLPDGQYAVTCYYFDSTQLREAEAAVREREEQLRSLTENVPCVLMRFDREHRIRYLSPQSERYNPHPVERMLGRTNREAGMPPELCDRWEAATERVFRTGAIAEMEFDFAGPSGMRTFALKFAPEFGPGQEVQYVLGVSSDITERKQAEAELRRRMEALRLANDEANRLNRAMVNREMRMVELKKEINELCHQASLPTRYQPESEPKGPS
jgi:PAS domain S-box-containing protein